MDMESFGNNTPSSAEEILQSLEKTPEVLIIEGAEEEIQRIGHEDVHEMLAHTYSLYYSTSEENPADARRIYTIYKAGIALGHKLYGEKAPRHERDEIWERLSDLSEILDLTTIPAGERASVSLAHFVDAYVQDSWRQALAAAEELPEQDQAVIETFSDIYTRIDWDTNHFKAAVGLVADAVNVSRRDFSSQSYRQNLSGPELRKATLGLFRELCETETIEPEASDQELSDILDVAIESLNLDTLVALFYKPGKTMSVHEQSVYLIRDLRNGSMTFNRLGAGQFLEGVFKEFVHSPIPEYGEYDSIARQTSLADMQEINQVGLYLHLTSASFSNADGTEVPLNENQELLIPVKYAGQTIFSER